MEVYYIRRRNGDIAVADLRKVSCLGTHKEERIFLYHSLPLSEEELLYAKDGMRRGIHKKLSQEILRRHGLELYMVAAICAVASFFIASFLSDYSMSVFNRILIAICSWSIAWFITHNLFHMSLKVIKAKEKYGYRIDGIEPVRIDEIVEIEEYYKGLYEYDLKTLIEMLAYGTLPSYKGEISRGLLLALECYLINCERLVYRYAENIINRRISNVESEIGHMETDTATGLLDIHLLALFVGLNKRI